ncbi:hypothetical protein [Burkholderia sp. Ax-1724]|uniref:hypothetical protein n=1 Tax=Burkholderia sp. Ax-1724 TaxID=2608336 RepID=UPI00142288F2|nr:hypothetical protein [Burkholderia sp. Ax-1724]NIF51443.1 hypothetical protein [Burkholderia sp. Ax-1724]
MIYTLIFTVTFYAYGNNHTIVHVEHDYPTREACHAAYDIASDQINRSEGAPRSISGTCLKVKQ